MNKNQSLVISKRFGSSIKCNLFSSFKHIFYDQIEANGKPYTSEKLERERAHKNSLISYWMFLMVSFQSISYHDISNIRQTHWILNLCWCLIGLVSLKKTLTFCVIYLESVCKNEKYYMAHWFLPDRIGCVMYWCWTIHKSIGVHSDATRSGINASRKCCIYNSIIRYDDSPGGTKTNLHRLAHRFL